MGKRGAKRRLNERRYVVQDVWGGSGTVRTRNGSHRRDAPGERRGEQGPDKVRLSDICQVTQLPLVPSKAISNTNTNTAISAPVQLLVVCCQMSQ